MTKSNKEEQIKAAKKLLKEILPHMITSFNEGSVATKY